MKMTMRFLLLAVLVPLILLSAKPASAQWYVGIHVGFGPPALPIYDQPVCPGDGYIWTPGYWAWDADDGYYWVPGTWIMAPEPDYLWTPGWWGWGDGGYFWHAGYWGPHVGFYGGINYGFGYFGDGFAGGRWQGGHFFYNSAVWHVGGGFHNVYRDDTVIRNTTIINNHISYNGGHGGIDRHPTPQEESYEHERHISPVADQTRQVETARSNPQLRASENHGRPAIAATARAGDFSGHDVVKAREAGGEYHPQPSGHEAQPGGEGARPANPAHASDLQQHQPHHVESTGNPKLDKKYQQQQQQLVDRQNQEHQQLQQRQEQEHQKAQQQHYNQQKQQQMEQRHQQQTQQMQQRHQQQTQRLQQRQSAPRESRPK